MNSLLVRVNGREKAALPCNHNLDLHNCKDYLCSYNTRGTVAYQRSKDGDAFLSYTGGSDGPGLVSPFVYACLKACIYTPHSLSAYDVVKYVCCTRVLKTRYTKSATSIASFVVFVLQEDE